MYLPTKFICKKSKARRDGTSVIFIQYCYNSEQRILLNTDVAIPPEYWNSKTQKISSNLPDIYGGINCINEKLRQKERWADDVIHYALENGEDNVLDFVKEVFPKKPFDLEQLNKPKINNGTINLDVFYNIDDYIKDKRPSVKRATINVIGAMKKHLLSFQKYRKQPITFDSFDVKFYEQFVNYLTYEIPHMRRKELVKGLKINSVGKSVKHMKSFLKDRMKKKIIPFMDLTDYKVMEEDVDAIYLSWKEISAIYHLDLSVHKHLEKYRDLLVLGCLTGFRFSDYSDIKPEEVRGGMLYVTQQKTLSTVVVPLRKDAKTILIDKYNLQMPQVSNPNFNEYIKEVCRLAGITEKVKITHKQGNKIIEETKSKYEWVTSHTCRRSFCTNEYLDETPVSLIMAISGHKTEKAFRRYIKADKVQKALMIKKLWDCRPAL